MSVRNMTLDGDDVRDQYEELGVMLRRLVVGKQKEL